MESAVLQARGLSKRFGAVTAVDNVDLDLVPGQCVGLIGPNGAGKSSLLALLAGSIRPSRGEIVLDGRDIVRLPIHARVRSGIARASQIPQTFARLSVMDNVRVAALFGAGLPRRQAQEWTEEVLGLCQLTGRGMAQAGSLGLLDRKRLELAKAIAARPKVLLLDEIAAGLTEPEIETMMNLVRQLKTDRTVVWVEHIPFALHGVCDRLVVMDGGAKKLDGEFDVVWGSDDLQEIYLGVPDDVIDDN
ncbi:ABC transporter ATP-binding protein [Pelagibacterium halotolerans]|uniref:ABC transporter ATP-binding protein n=1 Tax=Pelagibacterium halotolerans TaxID=531813 RepID=UPI00384BF713